MGIVSPRHELSCCPRRELYSLPSAVYWLQILSLTFPISDARFWPQMSCFRQAERVPIIISYLKQKVNTGGIYLWCHLELPKGQMKWQGSSERERDDEENWMSANTHLKGSEVSISAPHTDWKWFQLITGIDFGPPSPSTNSLLVLLYLSIRSNGIICLIFISY